MVLLLFALVVFKIFISPSKETGTPEFSTDLLEAFALDEAFAKRP
jgi:hypothetical protein